MRTFLAYAALCSAIGAAVVCCVLGPGRIYGIVCSKSCRGVVAKIQRYGHSDTDIPNTFLVEVHGEDGQAYIFPSSDKNWLIIDVGNHVDIRLYPAPWWAMETAHWQNAALIAKQLPPTNSGIANDYANSPKDSQRQPAVASSP